MALVTVLCDVSDECTFLRFTVTLLAMATAANLCGALLFPPMLVPVDRVRWPRVTP